MNVSRQLPLPWPLLILPIWLMFVGLVGCGDEAGAGRLTGAGFGDACGSDADCRAGLSCVDIGDSSVCTATCESDLSCPGGTVCRLTSDGLSHCVPGERTSTDPDEPGREEEDPEGVALAGEGEDCERDDDCAVGTMCFPQGPLGSLCQIPCGSATDCPNTSSCSGGEGDNRFCRLEPVPVCDCAPDEACVDGVCEPNGPDVCSQPDAPCTSATEPGDGLICAVTHEATRARTCRPGCAVDFDCGGGQICDSLVEDGPSVCLLQPVCPPARDGYLGVHVANPVGDPLLVGHTVLVTVDVTTSDSSGERAFIRLDHGNLDVHTETFQLDGAGLVPEQLHLVGGTVWVALPALRPAQLTYEATVVNDRELLVIRGELDLAHYGCRNPRSGAAALLQVLGGTAKTSDCLDLSVYRSIQVASSVSRRSTDDYLDRNGARDDLWATEFIFCPQAPTVVHSTEFCAVSDPSVRTSVAGHHSRGGTWEVDDFLLVETFRDDVLLGDGFTTQTHPGGDTFYCNPLDQLVCQQGCTATLEVPSEGRDIEPLAVASAVGDMARRHADGAVSLDALVPSDGVSFDLKISALDTGVEGVITPDLYVVTDVE